MLDEFRSITSAREIPMFKGDQWEITVPTLMQEQEGGGEERCETPAGPRLVLDTGVEQPILPPLVPHRPSSSTQIGRRHISPWAGPIACQLTICLHASPSSLPWSSL